MNIIEKFDDWNNTKKEIHISNESKLFINIGFEENGKSEFKRPVLVLKKVGNMFFVVPLTSKGKLDNKFYHKLKTAKFNEKNQKHKDEYYCILSQVKVIDKKRFDEHIGYVGKDEILEIKEKLRDLLL